MQANKCAIILKIDFFYWEALKKKKRGKEQSTKRNQKAKKEVEIGKLFFLASEHYDITLHQRRFE